MSFVNRSYPLERDFTASARLNLQHFLLKDTVGYLLHPDIPIHPDMVIADVACGTGIWTLDLARSLPSSVSFEGFDISADQFPPRSILPSNIKFGTFDGNEEIPADLVGKFDVVHTSFLVAVVKNNDPKPWIKNLMKMLKPGGYLMWLEGNISDHLRRSKETPLDSTKFPTMSKWEAERNKSFDVNMSRGQWVDVFDKHYEECGLQHVKHEKRWANKMMWRAFTDNLLLTRGEMVRHANDAEGIAALAGMSDDVREGAILPGLMPTVTIGMKPL